MSSLKFFGRRQQPQPVIPLELQPYYGKGSAKRSMYRGSLATLFVLLVAIVVVLALVVWFAAHQNRNNLDQSKSQASQSTQQNIDLNQNLGTPAKTPSSGATNTAPVGNPGL
jgi:cytoskeletal protein RodZ